MPRNYCPPKEIKLKNRQGSSLEEERKVSASQLSQQKEFKSKLARRVCNLGRHLDACACTASPDQPLRFTNEQRHSLYHNGFAVIPDAIPPHILQRAQATIEKSIPADANILINAAELVTHSDVIGLINESKLKPLLEAEMGKFPPIISSQVAVRRPGYEQGTLPVPHIDGSWGGPMPDTAEEVDLATGRPRDLAKWFGPDQDKRGNNDGRLWLNPERTMSIGGFTCLVGVALNDQSSDEAHGQFGVLAGSHKLVQAHFNKQRASGGIVGPDGEEWPRCRINPRDGKPQTNGMPDPVRAAAYTGKEDSGRWPWPEVTPVRLRAGDAVISLHSLPHCATPNLAGCDRQSVYFRVRKLRPENPHEGKRMLGHGVSDHCDVAYYGKQLEYPPHYDPFATTLERLCDHWLEWDGMKDFVAAERAAGRGY
jgi:hypothetical protein